MADGQMPKIENLEAQDAMELAGRQAEAVAGGTAMEENKAAVLRLFDEVFTKGNTRAFAKFGSPDVVYRLVGYPQPFRGPAAVAEWAYDYLAAFDVHLTVEEAVAAEDTVVVRWTMQAFHKGEYLGIPPTQTEVRFTAVEWFRFVDGLCVEIWNNIDTLGVLQQLGVFPKGTPPRALLQFVIWLQRLGRRRQLERAGG
jgi:steroid delta-isomerase-like uncharacterized protein